MRSGVSAVSAVALALLGATAVPVRSGGFYGLSARYADGFPPGEDGRGQELLDFASLRGKVVLVVNVASLCGYTDKDYRALAALHDRLARTGRFEVLAFPCNQFGRQEPWEEKEIVVRRKEMWGVGWLFFLPSLFGYAPFSSTRNLPGTSTAPSFPSWRRWTSKERRSIPSGTTWRVSRGYDLGLLCARAWYLQYIVQVQSSPSSERTAVTPTWNFFKHLVDHRGRVTRTFLKGASWTVLERAVDVAVAEAAKAGREL